MVKMKKIEFKIKKGNHLSNPLIIKSGSYKSFECEVEFTESCKYQLNEQDQGDQNKLFGFGFANKIPFSNPAHTNSIRWTWTYIGEDNIQLIPYWYEDGIRKFGFEYKKTIKIGEKIKLSIYVKDTYVLTFNNESISIPYNKIKSNAWVLTPYFGGNNVAPHDIKIIFHKFNIK
jgi:hypothetical protein